MQSRSTRLCLLFSLALFFSVILTGCGSPGEPTVEEPDEPADGCPVDCTALEAPPCMRSVCNDGSLPGQAGRCTVVPVEDGTACDDENACTVGDSCVEGTCQPGEPLDCSELDSACTVGQCDPSDGSCKEVAANDGDPCDDGNLCTTGATCAAGVCGGGAEVDCSDLDSACTVGQCDPTTGSCMAVPANEGARCDDGDRCTLGDSCQDGVCVAGDPMDCSSFDSACLAGVCDPATGACTTAPANDGEACQTDDVCLEGSTCSGGVCQGGSPKECVSDDVCRVGLCSPTDGSCVTVPGRDGVACDDGDPCTVGDACQIGSCRSGPPKDCSFLDSPCSVGMCDPDTGGCVAVAINENQECGIDFCHSGGTCIEGACVGGTFKDCSELDDICTQGVCDGGTGACVAAPANEGVPCDDGDLCTTNDRCIEGVCDGDFTCAHLESDCMAGYCDPEDGSCHGEPVEDGTSCNGGDLCLVGGTCISGVCTGGFPKNCAPMNTQCTVGVCEPSTGECVGMPANEGLPCDDGQLCTEQTICIAGVCGGGTHPPCSNTPDGCCPDACNVFNDADCACPGEFIDGVCVYLPTKMSSSDRSAARAECAALGPEWSLCTSTTLCNPETFALLNKSGCDCKGGDASCNCSGSNVYIQVENGDPAKSTYVNASAIAGCTSSSTCNTATTATCGAPLCCKH